MAGRADPNVRRRLPTKGSCVHVNTRRNLCEGGRKNERVVANVGNDPDLCP
jgi:hypothetical protein